MDFQKLKSVFVAVHATTKEHTESKRSYIGWVAARILIILIIIKDHRLGNILRGLFARSH
ncbi:hypothetical protein [Undibacterium curvum]|uniref:Uncharacterized protein n=1 Tax=Undibacterium curvum TaxID=2762294 RepID=A0ABR7A5C0_9BURK|nr:hypothetical protein [Undibacterium curvum]MBC3932001.1 hypothetical protein [Undibacterium curvum]